MVPIRMSVVGEREGTLTLAQLLIGSLLVLGGFAAGTEPLVPPHPLDRWIHPSVQGEARRVLRHELALLPVGKTSPLSIWTARTTQPSPRMTSSCTTHRGPCPIRERSG